MKFICESAEKYGCTDEECYHAVSHDHNRFCDQLCFIDDIQSRCVEVK